MAERERNKEHSSVLYIVLGKVQRERRFKGEMQSLIAFPMHMVNIL